MKLKLFPERFALLKTFVLIFLSCSFLIRLTFLFWNFSEVNTSFFKIGNTFIIGFLYDVGTISFFTIPYLLYLLIIPKKWYGSLLDKIVTYFAYALGLLIFVFSFLAEITFWEEFNRRFNFIAVDYLVYTNEVTKNIQESYPVPLLLLLVFSILFVLLFITKKRGAFKKTFNNTTGFKAKLFGATSFIIIATVFGLFITNKQAEQFDNRYNNELAKTGIYSFFAAFRNNELSYTEFYNTIDNNEAFNKVKQAYKKDSLLDPKANSIYRSIINSDSINKPVRPNVIFLCIESLSAKYLSAFGSDLNITPNLDVLANESVFFNNLYATGTRTVRGMEAITLSIPPTPGRSIVKRKNNTGLFTIGEVFKQEGYTRNFFYGGDGYFDNMNTFFGGNGFNIIDRGRGFLLDAKIKTTRTNIDDDEVTFENAWGICDEDLYNKVIKEADLAHAKNKPFFDFVMTTSNHRPYTYPEGKIDLKPSKLRENVIKYADYAIGDFIEKAKQKPWFKNTVFIIMADHCAFSAGRWALDVKNYHIPALIYNLPNTANQKVDQLCSQIDMFPTLFSALNWDYNSNLFGKDVLNMQPEDERAFIGNYRKLGFLQNNKLMVLSEQKQTNYYQYNKADNSLKAIPMDENVLKETTSFYQAADYLYHNRGLQLKDNK
jgi:phosphoglycerol transferase MdoB-like AlkP superfamily enzyme